MPSHHEALKLKVRAVSIAARPRSLAGLARPLTPQDPSLLLQKACLIDGKEVAMTSTFDVMDPATGEKWADAGECTAEETTRAIESAAAAFPSFSRTVGRERVKMLLKLDALIRENTADIAQIITLETGKPLAEAEAEVEYGASFTAWFAGEAERSVGQTVASGQNPSLRYITIKQPIGPVALLVPWNFVRQRRDG